MGFSLTRARFAIARALRALGLLASSALVATCGFEALSGPGSTLDLEIVGDTVLIVGAPTTLSPTTSSGAALDGLTLTWTSDAAAIVAVDPQTGALTPLTHGSANIRVRADAPGLPPSGVTATIRVRVTYAGIAFEPLDSLTGLGESRALVARGIDALGAAVTIVPATFVVTNPAIVQLTAATVLTARSNGTTTVTANFDGLSAQQSVRVRQVAKTITFAPPSLTLTALQRDTTISVTVRDTRDSVIVAPTVTWLSTNESIVTVDANGVVRGLQRAASSITAQVDTVVRQLNTAVNQVPTLLTKVQGDAQSGPVGTALPTTLVVEARDAGGVEVPGVSVTFTAAGGSGSVANAVAVTGADGRAASGAWTLPTSAGSKQVTATAVTSLNAVFGAVAVPGPVTTAVLAVGISTVARGATMPSFSVALRDQYANLATNSTAEVTVSAGGTTLAGTLTRNAVAGVATFGDVVATAMSTAASLSFTIEGLANPVNYSSFTVTGPALRVLFVVEPDTTVAGQVIAPAPAVVVRDSIGNTLTGFAGAITISLAENPGADSLRGTGAWTQLNGVRAYSALELRKAAAGYRLMATAPGLEPDTSAEFAILGDVATAMAFVTQPAGGLRNAAMTPAPEVLVTDQYGNPSYTQTLVSLEFGVNPVGTTLSGTTSAYSDLSTGIARFDGLVIPLPGVGFTLVAHSTGLTSVTSQPFAMMAPGSSRALEFVVAPSTMAADQYAPTLQVRVVDSVGTTVDSSSAAITLELVSGPEGAAIGSDQVGVPVTTSASQGVASFSYVNFRRAGGAYRIRAISAGLTPDTSAVFTITPGATSQLKWEVQPTSVTAGVTMAPAPQVRWFDAYDNWVETATDSVVFDFSHVVFQRRVEASGGAASLSDFSMTVATVGGYLSACRASGGSCSQSQTFNVNPAASARLEFVSQPTDALVNGSTGTLMVQVLDAFGNRTSTPHDVTFSTLPNTLGAQLVGTTTATSAGGYASVSGLPVNNAAQALRMRALSPGLIPDTSDAITVYGVAASLHFVVQPPDGARNAVLSVAPVVEVRDVLGSPALMNSYQVNLALTGIGNGAALGGTLAWSSSSSTGRAPFTDLKIDSVGVGYRLAATGSGMTGASSETFDISAFTSAHRLRFVQGVSAGEANTTLAPPAMVEVLDSVLNRVTNSTAPITLALAANPGSANLGGSTTRAAVNGVATFDDLAVSATANGYVVEATSPGLAGTLSPTFNIVASGQAVALKFDQQPTWTVVNSGIVPAPRVCAVNSSAAVVVGFSGEIELARSTPTGYESVATLAATAGCAEFSGLTSSIPGSFTLRATSAGLTSVTSQAFDVVVPGAPVGLEFVLMPSTIGVGPYAPAIQVRVVDSAGVAVDTSTALVTLELVSGPDGTEMLWGLCACPITASPGQGVATFSYVYFLQAGSGYRIRAISAGLSPDTSAVFTVTPGAPAKLNWSVQPTSVTAGATMAPAPEVRWFDAYDNWVTTATDSIVLHGPGGELRRVEASAGAASFDDLSFTVAGNSQGLTACNKFQAQCVGSDAFNVSPASPAQLEFTSQPVNTNTLGGPNVSVQVRDAFGNHIAAATHEVTLGVTDNTLNATLAGNTTVSAVGGDATFSSHLITKAAIGVRLTASAPGLTPDTSDAFTVYGLPVSLHFITQPANGVRNTALPSSVVVEGRDALGTPALLSGLGVDIGLVKNGDGTVLSGTLAVGLDYNTTARASFDNLLVNTPGSGYRFVVSGSRIPAVLSEPFDVAAFGPATKLRWFDGPASANVSTVMSPSATVEVLDAANNRVTSSTAPVTVALFDNPSAGTLGGTLTRSALSGVATFNDLSVNAVGSGYTLFASGPSLTGEESPAFSIVAPGTPMALQFTVQPSDVTAYDIVNATVCAVDGSGAVATGFSGPILLWFVRSGEPTPVANLFLSAGCADVAAQYAQIASTYTLRVTADGMAAATSNPFNVSPRTPYQLTFAQQPLNTVAGAAINPSIVVRVEDEFGNLATSAVGSVTLAMHTNPGGATLGGTLSVAIVNGIATFTNITLSAVGTGYRLGATTSLAGVTDTYQSATFDITTP